MEKPTLGTPRRWRAKNNKAVENLILRCAGWRFRKRNWCWWQLALKCSFRCIIPATRYFWNLTSRWGAERSGNISLNDHWLSYCPEWLSAPNFQVNLMLQHGSSAVGMRRCVKTSSRRRKCTQRLWLSPCSCLLYSRGSSFEWMSRNRRWR